MAAFLHAGLTVAIRDQNWTAVASIKARLQSHAYYRLTGAALRAGAVRGAATAAEELQAATEACRTPQGPLNLSVQGQIISDAAEVEQNILDYFEALFQGRHTATAEQPEPFDSGFPFTPDFNLLPDFLTNLQKLDQDQSNLLDLPINIPDLVKAADEAAIGRAPGLDGLPYEFYRTVLPVIGTQLADSLNTMLEKGSLTPSLQKGAVRLIPKVPGAPTASQFRPITLLNCDYKLLTKVFVKRLLPLLPSILTTSQLCSVPGRSIFDGCTALLSAVEACYRRRRPGFILNLDFFHAFDRVCMPYVDKVLEAMGFGTIFRNTIKTLHRDAKAVFLLQHISREVSVDFSIRQGDPLAALIFIIQLEPFLVALHRSLPGLSVGHLKEIAEAYMDDVDALGEKLADLVTIDSITMKFESVSGQILNRNRKSAILGLGSWAGRQDWPLPWLHSPALLKVFGVTFGTSLATTIDASWSACRRGVQSALNLWSGKRLPTLKLRRDAIETHIFSKLWYLAQIIPMPSAIAQQLTTAAGSLLWKGHRERLAWQELHCPLSEGGLAISSVASRAQALITKQFCWSVGNGGNAASHWAYWIGQRLGIFVPALAHGPHSPVLPPHWDALAVLLAEVFAHNTVDPAALLSATAADIYASFMDTPPPPKILIRLPDLPWDLVWGRLWKPHVNMEAANVSFQLIHNILPVRGRLARWGMAEAAFCVLCPGVVEDLQHVFVTCRRIADVWQQFLAALLPHTGHVADMDLLYLAWPSVGRDNDVAVAVRAYHHLVWSSRGDDRPPSFRRLTTVLRALPAPVRPLW